MYILDVIETCNNTVLASVLPVVKNIMLLIQIIVPFALLIAFTVEFVKLTINPEEKNGFRKVLNKLIAAVIVFVIPVLINVVMGAVGESTEFSSCWVNAKSFIDSDGEYVPVDEENPYLDKYGDEEPTKADKTLPQKIVNDK